MNHANALAHLEDYFDGTLPPDVHRKIEAHLAGCTRCRDELFSLGALLDTVAEMRGKQIEPSRDLWPQIAAQIARGPRGDAQRGGGPARRGDRGLATDGSDPSRGATGGRRVRWPWLAGAVGLAAAALLLVAVLPREDPLRRLAGGTGGTGGTGSTGDDPSDPAPFAAASADGANSVMTRELAKLGAQVASSRESVRPADGAGAAGSKVGTQAGTEGDTEVGTQAGTEIDARSGAEGDTTATTPSWRLFDQGLAVLDRAISDSRAALERDPNNPVLQKSLLAAYQKQLELIRWANRVVRQS
jgi:hypothetical protein